MTELFPNKQYHILAVDDNPASLALIDNILKYKGYKITKCEGGEEALKLVNEQNFDLVLLDVMMPGKDGFEVCSEIKQTEKAKDIPVIFITARTDVESINKGFDAGAHDYVTKPIQVEELFARIKTHLNLKQKTDDLKEINRDLDRKVYLRTKELEEANVEIKSQNDAIKAYAKQLKESIDELTKARISLKAVTFAVIVTLLLFILSEVFLEPIIERDGKNLYLILGEKLIIAMLFKPFEMLAEYAIIRMSTKRHDNDIIREI